MTDLERLIADTQQLLDAYYRLGSFKPDSLLLIEALLDVARRHQQAIELCEFLIDACATHRIPVPLNSSLLDLAADIAGGAVLIDVETTGGTT